MWHYIDIQVCCVFVFPLLSCIAFDMVSLSLVSYMNKYPLIIPCCGMKKALFTTNYHNIDGKS